MQLPSIDSASSLKLAALPDIDEEPNVETLQFATEPAGAENFWSARRQEVTGDACCAGRAIRCYSQRSRSANFFLASSQTFVVAASD